MVSSIQAADTYRKMLREVGELNPQDDSSHLGQFKKLVEGALPPDSSQSGADTPTNLMSEVVSPTTDSLEVAEKQSELVAEEKANTTQVANAFNVAANSVEGVVTVLGKRLEAYSKVISIPL